MTEPQLTSAFEMDGARVVCRVTMPLADDFKAEHNVDVLDVGDENGLVYEMLSDMRLAATIVHYFSNWDGSPEEFGEHWQGDTIEAGVRAFWGALVAFFPSQQRPLMEAILNQAMDLAEKNAIRATELLNSGEVTTRIVEHMNRLTDDLLERSFDAFSGVTQESPDSRRNGRHSDK